MSMLYMIKTELLQQKPLKGCFGTKEWSKNSGICRNCELKNDCGKSANNPKGLLSIAKIK
jgi:hypothetical protein